MKKGSTFFLKATLLIISLGVLAICIFVLPAGLRGIDEYKPVMIIMYLSITPFFIALYQSLNLLNYIGRNSAFSDLAVTALRKIKYCAIAISVLFVVGMPLIFRAADVDDAPGVVVIALIIIFASWVIATFAGVLQKLLQNVIAIKSENELTV
ncbi:MAG TPA: DUF2975 domain-containing protein [Candidatus Paceibacterota bacterium]|nr:DUF2975 domain-containing protein [Candidatus Paceibacterota bacterium]